MPLIVRKDLANTQVHQAADLLNKFLLEEAFWLEFRRAIMSDTITVVDDLVIHESDIYAHLKFMFTQITIVIEVVPYKTTLFTSSVLGHAEGNKIHENVRKLDALTLWQRVGHLGHESTHLLGYDHDGQGDPRSVPVVFGQVMGSYAKRRLNELYPND
jgi:hypothetical protein